MNNDQMNNDQLQEDLTEVLRVRRDKLTKLQEMGIEIGITPQWQFRAFLNPPYEGELPNGINIGRFGDVVENDIEATAKNFEKFIELSVKAFEAHGIHNIKYFYC